MTNTIAAITIVISFWFLQNGEAFLSGQNALTCNKKMFYRPQLNLHGIADFKIPVKSSSKISKMNAEIRQSTFHRRHRIASRTGPCCTFASSDAMELIDPLLSALHATSPIGLAACSAIGLILGLLGGGGSILAVPVFINIFGEAPKVAIAESLAVVSVAATVGCLTHIANKNVNFKIAVPFGICACFGSYFGAKVAVTIPSDLQLGLFAVFAVTSSGLMFKAALRDLFGSTDTTRAVTMPLIRAQHLDSAPAVNVPAPAAAIAAAAIPAPVTTAGAALFKTATETSEAIATPRFTPLLAAQAVLVGVLTASAGAGGGFVIVPSLTLVAGLPVKLAVGSSLPITAANALSGFSGYADGSVPLDGARVAAAALVAGAGAVAGTLAGRSVPQGVIKLLFAGNVLVLAGVTAVKMALQAAAQ